MRTLDEIIAKLLPEERAKVAARTKELMAEEVGLRNLRKARRLTQQRMAKVLHIDQGGISKIESRSDMLLSTLRTYLKGMGGSLRLIAEFEDYITEIRSLGEVSDIAEVPRSKRKQAPQPKVARKIYPKQRHHARAFRKSAASR
jgi:transcriptional regulator with XRE-family HTH domain